MPSTVIEYFKFSHLPLHLQVVSQPVAALANYMENTLPDGPEKSAGMRKLLEAKDCFVRSGLKRAPGEGHVGVQQTGMDFGWALQQLKAGAMVRRRGWNGKGMFLALQRPDAHSKMGLPYIYMSTVDGKLVPWLASQTDMLGEDWELPL